MAPTFPTMDDHKPVRATSSYDGTFENFDSQVLKRDCFLPEPIIYLLIGLLITAVIVNIVLAVCLYRSKRHYKKVAKKEDNEEGMEMNNLQ